MIVLVIKRWFYAGSCIGPFIIIREKDYSVVLLNHETIHYEQQKELWFIGAYVMYTLEFLFKIFYYKFNIKDAYLNVSFEREAFSMQPLIGYVGHRKPFANFKCIYLKASLKWRKL